jgi:hypothetical protein
MMAESRRPAVGMDALAAWCTRWLGVPPAAQLFETGYLSTVKGLRLADGREVVVKVRPSQDYAACWAAGLWQRVRRQDPIPRRRSRADPDPARSAGTSASGRAESRPGRSSAEHLK